MYMSKQSDMQFRESHLATLEEKNTMEQDQLVRSMQSTEGHNERDRGDRDVVTALCFQRVPDCMQACTQNSTMSQVSSEKC